MSTTSTNERFDRLLKAMVQGEPPAQSPKKEKADENPPRKPSGGGR